MAVSHKQDPIVLVIDFHHARGPEIEHCIADEGTNPATDNDWSLLPFMALSDGAHLSTEEFSYFTLRRKETPEIPATSLFGIACSRQLDAKLLINRHPDVTRSTVQKAVVVVTDSPQRVGQLREKLSVVTSAWFAQRDFSDIDILKKFREGLVISLSNDSSKDQNLGLSLREMIHEFKYQTLVLFKGLLLQPKMLFFGTRCERLCMIQFSLISLIPGLIDNLQDCADPAFDDYTQNVEKPTSLKTSDRGSLLAYMGLPLQIFGKGSMFGPYTPLQQLDLLADDGTKSYVVGSTNSLLLQQKDRYSDILINLDEDSINISSIPLQRALALSAADRRWIDVLTQIVNETWDDAYPSRPKTLGFMGSEEFIRLQFEEYLLALLSSMKYHEELVSHSSGDSPHRSRSQLQNFNIEGDPALDFNAEFLAQWQKTSNYALFSKLTSDALLFSITEPRHPSAGGLTMEDIQRRLSQQVADLHLDERVREGREALGRQLATGQKKVSAAFNTFWSDIESMREAQRKRNEEKAAQSQRTSIDTSLSPPPTSQASPSEPSGGWARQRPSIDVSQAQATVSVASQKASAYFSSWGSWASEKRKEWQEKRSSSPSPTPNTTSAPATNAAASQSPPTPVLSVVTETTESDRGRRRSMQQHRSTPSEDTSDGLSRSNSRRKRWSNILLRRESGEFKREDVSEANDAPYPKSPLSQGFPAYEPSATQNPEVLFQNENKKPAETASADEDGFTAVSLTPEEGLRVNLNPDESMQKPDAKEDHVTALPAKEEK
ncbi:Late secretory pathway protein AVL9 [Penicillium sp. IBT 35674x]|nr:Late secretory pathway protein AVL9 [Penicillium sp. IBT 35674x]